MSSYTQFTARELFMNPAMEKVFPQLDKDTKLQNVYSFAEVERRVLNYLRAVLNGTIAADGELVVKGKQQEVLRQVRKIKPIIEMFFNNMPKVTAALRHNRAFYLPYATRKQLEEISTYSGKLKAIQAVVDNLLYNSELGSTSMSNQPMFLRKKRLWERKVGYGGRLKHI